MVRGRLFEKSPPKLIVELGGIFLEVLVPVRDDGPSCGEEVVLYTHLYHRDDAFELYGFFRKEERELFLKLMKISGIGPKVALNILSRMGTDEFVSLIEKGDYRGLSKVPGIGAKRAKRIILELKESLPPSSGGSERASFLRDALQALGYKRAEIDKALELLGGVMDDPAITDEELVLRALRALGGA